jgi:hypothetical protein
MAVKVKYLRKQHIEWNAEKLLAEFGERFGVVSKPPIPVEEILENHLKLTLEIDDMESRLGFSDVLGALWAPERLVAIDQSLEPSEHPSMEGRYRYTVGHEIGHWVQHRHYFLANPDQGVLFAHGPKPPSVVCRTSQSKEPIEWQADFFSACLLMPRAMVLGLWERNRNKLMNHPLNLRTRLRATGDAEFDKVLESMTLEFVAGAFAPIFNVSSQAMKIRLEEIKLLETPGPLFSVPAVG